MNEQKKTFHGKIFSDIQTLPGFLDYEGYNLFLNLNNSNINLNPEFGLEIGVFCGRSLLGIAAAFPHSYVTGVDPFYNDFKNSPAFENEATNLEFISNYMSSEARKNLLKTTIEKLDSKYSLNLTSRVRLVELTQEKFFLSHDFRERYHFAHIDGEHTFSAVKNFLDAMDKILMPDALLIFDDMLHSNFPDIAEAIYTHDQYRKSFWPICFGFNKGVYLFNPQHVENIKLLKLHVKKCYSDQHYDIMNLHDDSFVIVKKPHRKSLIHILKGKIGIY